MPWRRICTIAALAQRLSHARPWSNIWGQMHLAHITLHLTPRLCDCRRCQTLLEKLKREQEAARAGRQFMASSCPICLEDFSPDSAPAPAPRAPAAAAKAAGNFSAADASGASPSGSGGKGGLCCRAS